MPKRYAYRPDSGFTAASRPAARPSGTLATPSTRPATASLARASGERQGELHLRSPGQMCVRSPEPPSRYALGRVAASRLPMAVAHRCEPPFITLRRVGRPADGSWLRRMSLPREDSSLCSRYTPGRRAGHTSRPSTPTRCRSCRTVPSRSVGTARRGGFLVPIGFGVSIGNSPCQVLAIAGLLDDLVDGSSPAGDAAASMRAKDRGRVQP